MSTPKKNRIRTWQSSWGGHRGQYFKKINDGLEICIGTSCGTRRIYTRKEVTTLLKIAVAKYLVRA